MIIKRIHNSNYTVVGNNVLNDERLDAETLGLLCYLIGRPHTWQVRADQLGSRFDCGRDRVYRMLKRLVEIGYIQRKKHASGEVDYLVFDQTDPDAENKEQALSLNLEIPNREKPDPEKPHVLESNDLLQNTDSELKKKESRAVAPSDGWPKDGFEQFWKIYPNKIGKPVAQKSFDKARRIVPWAEFWAGLMRYVNKTDDRAWCNPATWLNQHRWADKPAPTAPRGGGNGPRPTSNGFAASLVNSMKDASNDEGFRDD